MIKINLVREGRAVRGAGAVPAASAAAGGPANLNNILVVSCAVLGLVLAAGYWFMQKRTLSNRQEVVAARTQEAAKLEAIIKDVEEYQKRKDNLQARIDLINQLKQNQRGPVRIMDELNALTEVEIAVPLPLPVPAPVPDFVELQGYLNKATDGVDGGSRPPRKAR